MVRLCLYIDDKNIADITGAWMFNDPPELNQIIELSCYYKNGGFFIPKQEYFILKSKLNDQVFKYLFFELKWIIRSIKEIKEGGKPLFVIIIEALQGTESILEKEEK